MKGNKKHLVFGICICVAFVLFSAFMGVSVVKVRKAGATLLPASPAFYRGTRA